MVQWVGQDTWSKQLSSITNGVFIAQFFNTGILLLLVNANLTEHTGIPLHSYARGPFYDYAPLWYIDVGFKLIQAQLIAAVVPYITLAAGFGVPKVKQWLDSSRTMSHYKTKKRGMQLYKDTYSGPDYVIHFKYSGVVNIVYIALMYGIGMPLLFPIAALNIFNQWITERIAVAYLAKLPPALDSKLTDNCIQVLRWAPLLLLFNGYWMVSNQQIFKNTWGFVEHRGEQMKSEHFVGWSVDWASPVLLLCFVSVLLQIVQRGAASYLMRWGFAMSRDEIAVDEDLPGFFTVMRLAQRDQLIAMSANMKKNFGFEFTDPDTIEALEKAAFPRKTIVGTPWYSILSSPPYANQFQYTGSFVTEREKLINDGYPLPETDEEIRWKWEQSDLVMILLNLSYIPDEVVQSVDFTKAGWSLLFKESMDKYKAAFEARTGTPWAYQDRAVEDSYVAFKEAIDKEDTENGDGSFAGRKAATPEQLKAMHKHKGLQA